MSREWELDRELSDLIGKIVRGTATDADRERYHAAALARVRLMQAPALRRRYGQRVAA